MEEDDFISLHRKARSRHGKKSEQLGDQLVKGTLKRTIHHKETNTVNEQGLATEYS